MPSHVCVYTHKYIPGGAGVKNLPVTAGDLRDAGSIPGSARSPRRGHDNPDRKSVV